MNNKWLLISLLLNLFLVVVGLLAVHKLGGFHHLIYKMKNRGLAGTYEHRKNMFELLPDQDSTIIFLGNSITAQCEWAELFGDPKILNRGIPGDATDGILARLPHILRHNPKKLFLMIGVNDLFFHDIPYIINNYEKIIQQIKEKSPETDLFIQSVLPVNNEVKNTTIDNELIARLNEGIKKIADRNEVVFIDLFSKFIDEGGNLKANFTSDGIHLNGHAYLLWKQEIEKYMG